VPANTTVLNKTQDVTLTEDDPSTTTTITINQAAAPLGLGVSAVAAKSITLGATAEGADNAFWEAATITVSRNRGGTITELTKDTKAAGKFELNSSNSNIIELSDDDEVIAGDIYTITVDPGAGKSAPETTTANIGAISFAQATVPIKNGTTGYTNPLTNTGTGTVTYSVGAGASVPVNTKNEVDVGSTNGTATVTATVANDPTNGWFYPTNTAEYTLAIGDVVFTAGGSADWNVAAAGGTPSLVICGLTPSGGVSVEEASEGDSDGIASLETIKDGVDGSTDDAADDKGIAHVTATIENNSETRTKQAILTVTDAILGTMTITINQASN
jgi:hypothetical protein